MDKLQSKNSIIPKVIPVRHYLDLRSKGLLSGVAILLLSSAVAFGIAVTMLIQNQKLKAGADKFFMIGQSHADIALWADTTYRNNPEKAMAEADSLEAVATDLAAAQQGAKEKRQAGELAKRKVEVV